MKRLLALTALLTVSMVAGTSVQAAGYGVSWGNTNNYNSHGNYNTHGYNNNGSTYSGNYGNYNFGYNNGYQSNYGTYPSSGYNRSYHDTSHYDYHPPTVQRHRGHLDYTPGHYDFHRSGHNH